MATIKGDGDACCLDLYKCIGGKIMDFDLSKEQEMLRDSASKFLSAKCPKSLVREMEADEKGHPVALWQEMAQLGWLGSMAGKVNSSMRLRAGCGQSARFFQDMFGHP